MNRQTITDRLRNSKFTFFENGDFEVEDAVIMFKNFSGKATEVNPNGGKRTFALCLTDDVGNYLSNLGWNVKIKAPKKEGDVPFMYTEIVVNMNSMYPPTVELISTFNGKTTVSKLNGDAVSRLDKVWIKTIDIRIHPYKHDRPPYAYKGYANDIRATQAQDSHFGGKYENLTYEDQFAEEEAPEEVPLN